MLIIKVHGMYVTVHKKNDGGKSQSEKNQIVKNPPNLIVMFKPIGCCTKTEAAIFIPYKDFVKTNVDSHQLVFCANKVRKDQEITFCTIFNGTITEENIIASSAQTLPKIAPSLSLPFPLQELAY